MFSECFESERLSFRPLRIEDTSEIYRRYAQDPEVTRYLSWKPSQSIRETKKSLADIVNQSRRKKRFTWVIVSKEHQQIIGMIELRVDRFKAEVGYVLAKDVWGKGYATEALCKVIDEAFLTSVIYRVWAVCDMENYASARVMEKAGMSKEAILKRFSLFPNIDEQPRDVFVFAKVL